MLQFFIILAVIIVLAAITSIYGDYSMTMDNIRNSVLADYNYLIKQCKRDSDALKWVTTIPSRFESFMKSDAYQVRKPYDKFRLIIPTKKYIGLIAFIVIDKNLNPKFVVNFEPSEHDDGRTDKYLKHCVGYGKELEDFVKKCQNTVMEFNLENKRVKTIENIINK